MPKSRGKQHGASKDDVKSDAFADADPDLAALCAAWPTLTPGQREAVMIAAGLVTVMRRAGLQDVGRGR